MIHWNWLELICSSLAENPQRMDRFLEIQTSDSTDVDFLFTAIDETVTMTFVRETTTPVLLVNIYKLLLLKELK